VIDDPLPRPFLREWREARGMTQQGLAHAVGLTVSDLARCETSERGMRIEVLFGARPDPVVFVHPPGRAQRVDVLPSIAAERVTSDVILRLVRIEAKGRR
jgi:transcriptional regulator with XRE-family HTH domain